ncbi:putative transcription factor C2H2 family [Helianthus debilis subsp. tardiflorus]
MSSDSPVNHQWPDAELQDSSKSYALSGRIMLSSIIILFVVVIFLVFLHLYARWYLVRIQQQRRNRHSRRTRSTRIVFYVDNNPSPASTGGLDASVIKSLPVFVFSSVSNENTPECSVCLSEFEPGEKGRVLPKCKHSFHTECIDMWFHSNSTCPLCRAPVEAVETMSLVNSTVLEPGSSTSVPPSVQTTSLVERTKRVNDVRIDVPNRTELSVESQLTSPSQGFLSPGSRLLSRIINMSRKSPAVSPSSGVGPSCVHPVAATELDIESASQESTRPGSFK